MFQKESLWSLSQPDVALTQPITPEIIKGTEYFNLSGQDLQALIHIFPYDLQAEKVILLPDLSEGRSPLPTGSCIIFNPERQPEWRKFAVSDVGCGIQLLRSDLSLEELQTDNYARWDSIVKVLRKNKGTLGDLGSGNHFLDAAIDENGRVYFAIHTGSRDESPKATELINQPEAFDATYTQITAWARSNRDTIAEILEKKFGPLEFITDQVHNFYVTESDGKVALYKGAVRLEPNETSLIPSSMTDEMALVTALPTLETLHYATPHGTGRHASRRAIKDQHLLEPFDFDLLRQKIHIPAEIPNVSLQTETPDSYRDIDHALECMQGLVTQKLRLSPVAYIGQL